MPAEKKQKKEQKEEAERAQRLQQELDECKSAYLTWQVGADRSLCLLWPCWSAGLAAMPLCWGYTAHCWAELGR